MNPSTTIVYYTSNREKPEFEGRIIRSMLHASKGLPIISVSQKPIDLGTNICVGDVGASGRNAWRQMQIGAMRAKTKYVCPAEADMLYPKEYFRFIPPRDDVFYIAAPLYVCFNQRGKGKHFSPKPRGSEAAMVVNRELLLHRMEEMFANGPMWGPLEEEIALLHRQPLEYFHLNTPVITFNTDQNMHKKTPHDTHTRPKELAPFGTVYDLIKRYMG